MDPRPTSSVYSDTFELDNLLHRLSLEALQSEKESLNVKLALLREKRSKYNHAIYICRAVERELARMYEHTIDQGNAERNKWFANCTAF